MVFSRIHREGRRMVLIAYIRCPIFKFERLFPQNFPSPGSFWALRKWGFVVPLFLVLHSEMMRQLITIWPLSTFTKFPVLSVEKEKRTGGTMVCVNREHGSQMVSFPYPSGTKLVFHTDIRQSVCETTEGFSDGFSENTEPQSLNIKKQSVAKCTDE